MSIISSIDANDSAALARRFALLASSYLEDPSTVKRDDLQVPLENLFRLLEMFRYEAFSDEPRAGVLALEGISLDTNAGMQQAATWHKPIELALGEAVGEVFLGASRDEAVDDLQDGLRGLARDGVVGNQARTERVREFLQKFQTRLATA
jgi:hypothetical protein